MLTSIHSGMSIAVPLKSHLLSEYELRVSVKQRLAVFSRQEKGLLHIMVACGVRVGRGSEELEARGARFRCLSWRHTE